MLFELGGPRAFNRPVAAVVDAGRHLVEQRAFRRGEELAGQHADIVERLGDPLRHRRRRLGLRLHDRGGGQ